MVKGILFTSEFLTKGVTATGYWRAIDDADVETFRERLLDIFKEFPTAGNPNEATTELDLINPVIEALGWSDYLTEQTVAKKGRSDIPDYLLFEDSARKGKANNEGKQADRYKHGLAIMEAKAWNIQLDRKEGAGLGKGVPSNQILRYLSLADVQSNKAVKWGILTNGREWRLYYQDAKSRSEEFLALDLPHILNLKCFEPDLFSHELIEEQEQNWLKVFYAFFRKGAFVKTGPENISFHQLALHEGQHWEEKVAEDLSDVVFNTVLPKLAQGLAQNDLQRPAALTAEYLAELREATLILLYRLLFLLYAEDRNLLPVNDTKHDNYFLRFLVRGDISKRVDDKDVFSKSIAKYYRHVINLCSAVDEGDASIGLPPYNGGLFDQGRAPLLLRSQGPGRRFRPAFRQALPPL